MTNDKRVGRFNVIRYQHSEKKEMTYIIIKPDKLKPVSIKGMPFGLYNNFHFKKNGNHYTWTDPLYCDRVVVIVNHQVAVLSNSVILDSQCFA